MSRQDGVISALVSLLLCAATWLSVRPAEAYCDPNARAMGVAGAYSAVARNLDAVAWNPANLGLPSPHRVSDRREGVKSGWVDKHFAGGATPDRTIVR